MNIISEVAAELFSMFLADRRLATAIVVLVALVAVTVRALPLNPLVGGTLLFCGCLAIVVGVAVREAKQRRAGS